MCSCEILVSTTALGTGVFSKLHSTVHLVVQVLKLISLEADQSGLATSPNSNTAMWCLLLTPGFI